MQYARLLKRWLEAKQLTPTEAAPLFGVSFQALYAHLSGESVPPLSRVPVLAGILGVPEAKLRRTIERERAKRRAAMHGADSVADATGATATSPAADTAEVRP